MVRYQNHQIIEAAFDLFKKSGHKIFESIQLEHARDAQREDAQKFLVGKYIRIGSFGVGTGALYKVISIKECGGGAQTLFTLLVVNGEQYHARVVHGGDVSLLAMTELPVYVETEIWVEARS